jgi:hypothetical protein
MRPIRAEAEALIGVAQLHPDLVQLVDDGFTVADGAVFFARELRLNDRLRTDGLDRTGQEALINKIHLDDLIDVDSPGWAADCVAQGVLLAARVLEATAAITTLPIDVVVTVEPGRAAAGRGGCRRELPVLDVPFLLPPNE